MESFAGPGATAQRLRWRRLWRTAWRSLARRSSWCWGTRSAPPSTALWTAGSRRRPLPGPGPPERRSKVTSGASAAHPSARLLVSRPDATTPEIMHTHWHALDHRPRRGPLHCLGPSQSLREVQPQEASKSTLPGIDTVLSRGMQLLPVRLADQAVWKLKFSTFHTLRPEVAMHAVIQVAPRLAPLCTMAVQLLLQRSLRRP